MKKESGLLSLEACIAVTVFIFLMLFLYSFFVVFEVRNEVGHSVLAAANSLSLDGYENSTLGASDTVGNIFYNIYGNAINNSNDFTDHRNWYDMAATDDEGTRQLNEEFLNIIKTRFIAYLTGDNPSQANKILQRYHIQDGIDGLNFSDSYISDGNLYLSVKYKIEYEFNMFNFDGIEFKQSACSKIWK